MRAAQYNIAYDEIRGLYELDRKLWTTKEEIYARSLAEADKRAKKANNFWSRNKGTFAFFAGVIIGGATTVAIVFAVNQTGN